MGKFTRVFSKFERPVNIILQVTPLLSANTISRLAAAKFNDFLKDLMREIGETGLQFELLFDFGDVPVIRVSFHKDRVTLAIIGSAA